MKKRATSNAVAGLATGWAIAALAIPVLAIPVLAIPAPAAAQSIDIEPIAVGDGAPKAPVKTGDKCKGLHDVSLYDPHAPANPGDDNHTSIEAAICHAKEGGEVVISRDLYRPFLPPFRVDKANLTIRASDAADGGTIAIEQGETGACVVIDPDSRGKPLADITTRLVGFTFISGGGPLNPCIAVKKGRLILEKSRVLVRGGGVAIKVEPTGSLEFTGGNFEEHGVVSESATGGPSGFGVIAGEAREIAVRGVRFQGLEAGVVSHARQNTLADNQFTENLSAVVIVDAAIVSAYAPSLTIEGGVFAGNGAAVRLSARPFDATGAAAPDAGPPRPFRGAVTIGAGAGGRARFDKNDVGVEFAHTHPRGPFKVSKATFSGTLESAVSIAMLETSAPADFIDVDFTSNVVAVTFDGALDGAFSIMGDSSMTGAGRGVALTAGGGAFRAELTSVGGMKPALDVGAGWRGDLAVSVKSQATAPSAFRFAKSAAICSKNLEDKVGREAFRRAFKALKLKVGGNHISRLFGADTPDQMSAKEMKEAQGALCAKASS
jgi:hypothetical protein